MPLRLAGETETVQGLDGLGWLRRIAVASAGAGLQVTQEGAGAGLYVRHAASGGVVLDLEGATGYGLRLKNNSYGRPALLGVNQYIIFGDGYSMLMPSPGVNDVLMASNLELGDRLYAAGGAQFNGDVEYRAGGRVAMVSFGMTNVAANLTGAPLERMGGVSDYWNALAAGSILAVSLRASADRSAGTLTIKVNKAGVEMDATLRPQLDATNVRCSVLTRLKDAVTFAANEPVSMTVDTSADWAPATADIIVDIYVEV